MQAPVSSAASGARLTGGNESAANAALHLRGVDLWPFPQFATEPGGGAGCKREGGANAAAGRPGEKNKHPFRILGTDATAHEPILASMRAIFRRAASVFAGETGEAFGALSSALLLTDWVFLRSSTASAIACR